jgi:hypothetical protein
LTEILEEVVDESIEDTTDPCSPEELANDTNEEVLNYFSRVSKHYLHLAKHNLESPSRHNMVFPIIADSGANWHMFNDLSFFDNIQQVSGKVILGDGITCVPIQGIGNIRLKLGDNIITIKDVRHVPDLAESIYSLFHHIQSPNHGLQSSFDTGLYINFPGFTSRAVLGDHDIYLDASPVYAGESVIKPTLASFVSNPTVCRSMTQNDKNKIIQPTKKDHLLAQLRQYYKEVKTKRQLNFDVPAGFRKDTVLQRNLKEAIAAFPSPVDEFTPLPDNQTDLPEEFLTSSIHDDTISDTSKITHPIPLPDTTSSLRVPLIRCVDKPSSSLPSRITLNEDFIRASVGFRRIDTMKTHLSTLYHDTIKLDSSPSDAVLDRGDLATIRKSP